MAGGKGGSQTSSVEIPEYIEAAAQRNLNKAERISQLGYVPYYGPDVAAFTPMQQAAMQNVSGAAGAFGMATPQGQDIYGMPAPTEYAGGIQGYSSAPMFEQAQAELAARRPAQKSYIDSFFIDPFTGAYGSNVAPAIDYTQIGTMAQDRRDREAADRQAMLMAEQMRTQGSALSAPQYNTYVTTIQEAINDTSYDPKIDVLTPEQQIMIQNNPEAQLAQDALYMNQLGNANNTIGDDLSMLFGSEPSFESPSSSGSYGGSLVTGQLSTDLTGIPGLAGELVDSIYQRLDFEGAVGAQGENFAEAAGSTLKDDGTYDISAWFDPSAEPTIDTSTFQTNYVDTGPEAQVVPMPMNYGDSTFVDAVTAAGDDVSDFLAPTGGSDDGGTIGQISPMGQDAGEGFEWVDKGGYLTRTWVGTDDTATTTPAVEAKEDLPGNVITRALNIGAGKKDDSSDSGYAGESGDGCVVATHAVNSGAFTPSMKREAVVWCMHNLHEKWWGEAIRRGYRYLGRKKIEQGKAHEHYQEFRNYIDFASGKKRTIKGAIHFAARTVQFFAVGLVKGDA